MEKIDDYIQRITRLANRNEKINVQLQELVGRYESIQEKNNLYKNLSEEYTEDEGLEESSSKRKTRRFRMVSLLYVVIRGFRDLQEHPKSEELVDALDEIHMLINDVARKYNILRVKTIGDSFLFASGILKENHTNPIDVLLAAREMQEVVKQHCYNINNKKSFWELSIGVHTGPVTAENTGKKNSPFVLSGESVNVAYRLGQMSNPSQIIMSVMTYELVKEFYNSKKWGRLPVKYKGNIDVYSFEGIRANLTKPDNELEPNHDFLVKYGQIQFLDIQELFLDRLERELPRNLYYHNVKHTIDVVTEVELIGWAESLNEEEVLLLKLAALFHDGGHIISYREHEFYSSQIAREILQSYNYSNEQIETVCRLIMATRFPPEPSGTMEMVICDSDLDYLGRGDFIPVSNALYQELKDRDMIDSFDNWNKLQLDFIKKHQYYTKTARNLREVNKLSQIDRLKRLLHSEFSMAKK